MLSLVSEIVMQLSTNRFPVSCDISFLLVSECMNFNLIAMEVSLDMYDLLEIREARDIWAEAITREYTKIRREKSCVDGPCKIQQESFFLRE